MNDSIYNQAEAALKRNIDALQTLHSITSSHLSFPDKAQALLEFGCQYFNMPLGIISRVRDDKYTIISISSEDGRNGVGSIYSLSDVYCKATIQSDEPVNIPYVGNLPQWKNSPAYLKWELESYVGTCIIVNRSIYGTLCFSSPKAKKEPFTKSEEEILKLIAHWVGTEVERQLTNEALQQSEETFRQFFELAPIGMGISSIDGRILQVNGAFCRLLGYTKAELAGKRFAHITHPDDIAKKLKLGQQLIDGKITDFAMENRYIGKNGRVCNTVLHTTLIVDKDNKPNRFIGQMVDITARKEAEEALRQAQKLESIGILAGGIAHDFNNLLTGIMGQASLALAKLPFDSSAREHIHKSVVAAERAAELTRQLLAYAGKGHSYIEPIQLNDMVTENIELLNISLKDVSLHMELAPNLPLIEVDRGQAQQVVMNLAINATEAVQGCERNYVTILTYPQTIVAEEFQGSFVGGDKLASGRYVCLQVSDTGVGMDLATQERIFDPFFSTKEEGRGLGLSATFGIIRAHKGGLIVQSEAGSGTTFMVLFPASSSTLVAKNALEARIPIIHDHASTILVIDDEEPVREAVQDILHSVGFHVLIAQDGVEGVKMYKRHQADIELVLLDMRMPGMDGEETFKKLKAFDPDVRVVLSSGYNEMETMSRFVGEGIIDFLQKPYDLETLIGTVEALLG